MAALVQKSAPARGKWWGGVFLTAPNLKAEGGVGVESAWELPSRESWWPWGTGSRRCPGPAGPPAALTGGASAEAMTPHPHPALLPGGRQAVFPGQESHL